MSIPIPFTVRAVFKTVLQAAAVHSPNRYLRLAFNHSATPVYNPVEGFEPPDPLLSFYVGQP